MLTAELGWQDDKGIFVHEDLIKYGPSIRVIVRPYSDPNQTESHHPPAEIVTLALVDTGAAASCIDTHLAAQLGLSAIDTVWISGAGGAAEHPEFMAHVDVPGVGIRQYGKFAGVELTGGGQHGVLLGRTP